MERLGDAGVTVILKVDHERTADRSSPWTVVLSGPGVGASPLRHDDETLDQCLRAVLKRLRATGGEWEWLDDLIGGR